MTISISPIQKRFVIGLWITVLYAICICLVVYSLSSYQFQDKLNSIPYVHEEIETLFIEHLCDISGIRGNDKNIIVKIPCLPNSSTVEVRYYTPGQVKTIYKEVMELTEKSFDSLNKRKQDSQLSVINLKKLQKEDQNNNSITGDIENLEGNIFKITLDIEELTKKQKQNFEKYEVLLGTFSDIKYFENFFRVFSMVFGVESFWAIPKPILEIFLILSMGILGSLMFLTIEFLKDTGNRPNDKISMYLFRPFLGMIVALSVYVMVKSGQTTFLESDGGYISPFIISFLGIISGMLAEQGYQRLVQAGGRVFNGNDDNK